MKSLHLKYSKKFRLSFLLLTMIFLLLFFIYGQSLILLMFFVNMLYIYIRYIESPFLVFEQGQLIQSSFIFKTLDINAIEKVKFSNEEIVFETNNQQLTVKKHFLEEKSKKKLIEFASSIPNKK
jgi:hypothetical protein